MSLSSALLRPARSAVDAVRLRVMRRRVTPAVNGSGPPQFYDDAAEALLAASHKPDRYGYDEASLRRRGRERAATLEKLSAGSALEVGCGDGVAGRSLADCGVAVTLTDMDDWRHDLAKNLPFHRGDACGRLPFEDGSFDLAYSFNTFEHLHDPAAALAEMRRVVRPGGSIYLKFGPLYAGAWGLHAYKTLPVPYAQFVFSPAKLDELLRAAGIHDLGDEREELQPMNRWRLGQFERLFTESGCETVAGGRTLDAAQLWMVGRCPAAFAGRGLTFNDLVVKTLRVTLRRPA